MALVWSEKTQGNLYEIRSAGSSLRLYRNGIHHSQYNHRRPLSGAIWDLLAATAFFRDSEQIDQALILGFGAGAAGRLLREIAAPDRVVGIDMDPIHLSVADAFFDCGVGCELLAADAIQWVASQHKTERQAFDWILEDLYSEDGNIPSRCAPTTAAWFSRLASMLKPDGMLVVNLVEPSEIKKLPLFTNAKLKQRFPHVVQLSLPAYDNRILAFSRQPFTRSIFQENIQAFYKRFPACRGIAKKYRITAKRVS